MECTEWTIWPWNGLTWQFKDRLHNLPRKGQGVKAGVRHFKNIRISTQHMIGIYIHEYICSLMCQHADIKQKKVSMCCQTEMSCDLYFFFFFYPWGKPWCSNTTGILVPVNKLTSCLPQSLILSQALRAVLPCHCCYSHVLYDGLKMKASVVSFYNRTIVFLKPNLERKL